MALFDRRLRRPEYVAAPVEPPVPTEVRIAELDDRLAAIAAVPPAERSEVLWCQLDRLLDMRLAIRPPRPRPVPVVPGIGSVIDNRRENP